MFSYEKNFFPGSLLSLITSRRNDKEFATSKQDSLFSLTSENALKSCGGKSRILLNEKEEIIKIDIKDYDNGKDKFVEFTAVETFKKGGNVKIISCLPRKNLESSVIKTLKSNYKLKVK